MSPEDERATPTPAPDATTHHVRRAGRGDLDSLAWLVERFQPLLLAQARYRLGSRLRRHHDPEDLVADTWSVALPRLAEIVAGPDRATPILVRFLASTLFNRYRSLVRRYVRRGETPGPPESEISADVTGVLSRVARSETRVAVERAIEALPPKDREIVVLRGIEQHPYADLASVLRESEGTLSVRYSRALGKLRQSLSDEIAHELAPV